MYELWQFILLTVLIFLAAFFAASETALMSLSRIRLRQMVDEKIKGASRINRLLENKSELLGAILVGNNLVNIAASAVATALSIKYFGNKGVGIATGVMTILILVFGEITPKSIAVQNAESMSLKMSKGIFIITVILRPFVLVFMFVTRIIIKMLGGTLDEERPFITEEELKIIVNASYEEGVLEKEEKKMICNVFEFGGTQVREIMQPRIDVIAAEVSMSYDELMEMFRAENFLRVPVYEESIDNIIGILYIKDIISYDPGLGEFDIHKFIREPNFTFEFKKITEVFSQMRGEKIPMSIVLDEYGGTAGIVTIEDIVEEIVGEIEDEYGKLEEEIESVGEGEYMVDGKVKIDIMNDVIGTHIESEEFDSVGGLVIGEFGEIPEVGEKLEYEDVKLIVEKTSKNRIDKIRIIVENVEEAENKGDENADMN